MRRNKISIWSIIVAVPVLFSVSACSKFLDRKPLQATLSDLSGGVLQSQALGMYNTLTNYAGFTTLPWIDVNSIRDDDATKGSISADGNEIIGEYDTYLYSKNDWAPDTYWNDHYYMIQLANTLLYTADSLKATDEASKREIGEALFFRAYSYFDLVKCYGDIPLINFYSSNPSGYIRPKSKQDAIFAQIDSDLNVASQYLPLNWALTNPNNLNLYPGRLTSGAANTLWAQTYLWRASPGYYAQNTADYAKVISLCTQVESSGQYILDPSFTDIWKDGLNGAGKNGPESIFEEQSYVGQNNTPWKGVQWGTSQNVRQAGASNVWNLGWGWNVPTQTLVNNWKAADSTDPRLQETILFSGQYDGGPALGGYGATLPPYSVDGSVAGTIPQPYWNKKVYSDPAMRQFTGEIFANGGADWINHRIIRYADVILMHAEAANETGDGATAAAYLEQIRNRASGNLGPTRTIIPPIPFVNQAQMRTAIKNERHWEFAMEGYRFYDLVRWGDANIVLGPLGYTNKDRFYPIPQPAIDASGGVLIQNPEW